MTYGSKVSNKRTKETHYHVQKVQRSKAKSQGHKDQIFCLWLVNISYDIVKQIFCDFNRETSEYAWRSKVKVTKVKFCIPLLLSILLWHYEMKFLRNEQRNVLNKFQGTMVTVMP